jgi:hypothetical protein
MLGQVAELLTHGDKIGYEGRPKSNAHMHVEREQKQTAR